jgi:diaminohydroxyphosphoribosylaminopyrimidine deaminase/5-amino-6-(5-phosphoribosylamino)uracil reductase
MINTQFMQRGLLLAELGAGLVSPNPMVGCVIVHENRVIGEGWHQKYGEAHAEVNAINSVEDKTLLPASTAYVTLEPCSHFGKTPPCADLLIKHQIKKVVVCNHDPNPLVAGKGIEKLQQAGIEVEVGMLEEQGRALNKRFFTFIEKKRSYIFLKWAESADGFIAKPNYEAVQISNNLSRRWVHKMRAAEDAIMVGTNTVRYDNPSLNTRFWTGKNPTRVFIDKHLSVPQNFHVFDGSQSSICYNLIENNDSDNVSFVKIPHLDTIEPFIIQDLYERKIQSLVIEGGTFLLQRFIDLHLFDEAIVLKSKRLLGRGIAAPAINQTDATIENLGDNWLIKLKKS